MTKRIALWRYAASLTLVGLTLIAARWAAHGKPDQLRCPLSTIPYNILGWEGRDESSPVEDGVLAAWMPASYLARLYQKDGQTLRLLVAYYVRQRGSGGKTMYSPKNCLPGSDWEIWDRGTVPLERHAAKINKFAIRTSTEKAVVLYWYQSGAGIVASEYLGKLLLIRHSALGEATGGAVVKITCSDASPAIAEARQVASIVAGELQKILSLNPKI